MFVGGSQMENLVFECPGFKLEEGYDTGTHIVNVGTVDGLTVEMLIFKRALRFGNFLIAQVRTEDGKKLWAFREEEFDGFGRLVWSLSDREHFIVLVNKDDHLCKVIPLTDLPKMSPVKIGEEVILTGGRGIKETYQAKVKLAKQLGLKYQLSSQEKTWLKHVREKEAAELAAKQAADAEARKKADAARKAEREAKIKNILNRPTVEGWTEDGKRRFGVPVSDEEWKILDSGTFVMLVGEEGSPMESFRVGIDRKGIKKDLYAEVSADKPVEKAEVFQARDVKVFIINDEPKAVPVVDSQTFKQLSSSKELNSGTLLAVAVKDSEKFAVYAMKGFKGVDTIGHFTAVE